MAQNSYNYKYEFINYTQSTFNNATKLFIPADSYYCSNFTDYCNLNFNEAFTYTQNGINSSFSFTNNKSIIIFTNSPSIDLKNSSNNVVGHIYGEPGNIYSFNTVLREGYSNQYYIKNYKSTLGVLANPTNSEQIHSIGSSLIQGGSSLMGIGLQLLPYLIGFVVLLIIFLIIKRISNLKNNLYK